MYRIEIGFHTNACGKPCALVACVEAEGDENCELWAFGKYEIPVFGGSWSEVQEQVVKALDEAREEVDRRRSIRDAQPNDYIIVI